VVSLGTHPEHRRRKLASSLLSLALRKAKADRMCVCPTLHVSSDDLPALTMYRDFGYVEDGPVVREYYEDGGDAVRMFKDGIKISELPVVEYPFEGV